jgi:hypothetical protein
MARDDWKDAGASIGDAPEVVGPKCKVCGYEPVEYRGAVCEYCKVKYNLKETK